MSQKEFRLFTGSSGDELAYQVIARPKHSVLVVTNGDFLYRFQLGRLNSALLVSDFKGRIHTLMEHEPPFYIPIIELIFQQFTEEKYFYYKTKKDIEYFKVTCTPTDEGPHESFGGNKVTFTVVDGDNF